MKNGFERLRAAPAGRYTIVSKPLVHSGPVAAIVLLSMCTAPPDRATEGVPPPQVIGSAPPATGTIPSVVLLESSSTTGRTLPGDTALMDQFAIAFTPGLLVVQMNQVVAFRNSEEVSHNVRAGDVTTNTTLFNVVTDWQEVYHHRFSAPGEYTIMCDIHPGMNAIVLVVDTPYVTLAESDGTFSFAEVPPGSYTLRIWSVDPARRFEQPVEIEGTVGQVLLAEPRLSDGV